MKSIIWAIVIFFSGKLYSQRTQNDCELLSATIRTQVFKDFFYIVKYNANPLFIIDSLHLFERCKIDSVSGREVIFSVKTIKNDINTIHIYRVDKLPKDKNQIYFWNIYTGGTLIITMKKKKGRFILSKYSMGAI
jgi:hypothetical protein